MGSAVPFQDLNLSPSPQAALSTARDGVAGTTVLKVPKVEPELEPLEDSLHVMDSPEQLFSSSTSDFSNSQNERLPESSVVPSDNGNVYSEYRRITELFRTAFSQRLQERYDDVSVVDPDSRAIVPVNVEDAVSSVAVAHQGSRRFGQRSSELVRVNDLGLEAQRHFRDVVRRTRMIYDALRIVSVVGEQCGRRPRGDLRASSIMRDHGLWLNQDRRIVGSIPGIEIGDLFFFRMELCVLGLHGQIQAGIDYLPASRSSSREPIATSIIVSGGYEDDEDAGDTLIYTGQGGQGKLSKQCMPQKLEGGNLALERSMNYGIEIRVIRGFKYEGRVSSKIYVYDGLYKIVDYWSDVGKSGFGVYKYKLMRIDGQPQLGSSILRLAETLRIRPLSVRPRGYLSLDISNSKESVPVLLFNDIDNEHDPLCHDYLPKTVFPPYAFNLGRNGTGCECESGCNDGCLCAMKNGGEFAYDQNGFLLRGKPLIFECGAFCKCPPHCRNRVSQRGLRNRLEVFRSRETGWGVRSLDLIQAGAFICEYAGVVLTREQAQIFTMNGDILIYPHQFSTTWAEWGDLSQIYPDYVRPSYPSVPPLDFAMDVSRMRNVACYISQSSSPNVLVQFVLYDHNNLMFPHLMLFAMENIPPLRELSLDYGVAVEWTGKLTICN